MGMQFGHSDSRLGRSYREAMERGQPYISLTLDVKAPIEIADFVSAFTALSSEYDRFIRDARPDLDPEATLYVREVRQGSIIATLIPWIPAMIPVAVEAMGSVLILEDFVRRYGGRLSAYLKIGGRVTDASKGELKDFTEQVAAIANNPGSTLEIAAIEIQDGEKITRAAFKFDTSQAQSAREQIEQHRKELEHVTDADHQRVLMVFTQSNVKSPPLGKRTGEQVKIEEISDKSLPLVYASELSEQRIKHEIVEAEDNVYKKGFIVDVNVMKRNGEAAAYRVTALHQVIDLPDP